MDPKLKSAAMDDGVDRWLVGERNFGSMGAT